jgi:hypothetical protein
MPSRPARTLWVPFVGRDEPLMLILRGEERIVPAFARDDQLRAEAARFGARLDHVRSVRDQEALRHWVAGLGCTLAIDLCWSPDGTYRWRQVGEAIDEEYLCLQL